MKKQKAISYPGSVITPKWKKAISSPLVSAIGLLLLIGLCVFFLQPYYGNPDPIITAYSENMQSLNPESIVTAITPAPTDIPFQIPLLVNEKNPLPAGYVPNNLVSINDIETGLFTPKEQNMMADAETIVALMEMLKDAHADGITVWQISEAYRSVADQQKIWDDKYQKYLTVNGLSDEKALEAVKRRVATPGSSEHHTGLALDITVPGKSFHDTEQHKWLQEHCHEYGFVIRYAAEKEYITGISDEPWHIRYVGIEAAKMMKEENWCLEEYIQKYCRKFL